MKTYSIPAIRVIQKCSTGHEIFTGRIKLKDILEPGNTDRDIRFKIHKWEHDQKKEKGYQRLPEQTRIDKIKHYLQREVKNPIFPSVILVNARNDLRFKKIKDDFGELAIDQTLYVIDGQHRIEAFKDIAQNEELLNKYGYIQLPIIILSNFNYREEVEQFFIINSRQKPIKTDLAQRIYIEISKDDENTKLISEKDKWQMPATLVVDELNRDENSHWYGLISLPDDDEDAKKERLITQNSFIKSLKPFFIGSLRKWDYSSDNDYENGHIIVKECKKLVNDYWNMIEEVYPDAFDDKKRYILFKTIGVFSLHILLADFMDSHQSLDPKEAISGIKELLKYARDNNKFTLSFWEVGNKGARNKGQNAGAYSSASGHNRIALSILHKKDITDL